MGEYTINEKYLFHKMEVLETGTDKLLDSFPGMGGMVVSATAHGKEYLIISIPKVHTYELQIVNRAEEDITEQNLKIVMLQGGETIENVGIYTANVFFIYDLKKNLNMPEIIRLEINNSPNIMQYSGIIKLSE